VDGVRYADGQPGEASADPFALAGLTIEWGRDNTVDQPDPATCSFRIMDPPGGAIRFDDTVALGSTVVVWTELAGRRAVVFGGRVTDLEAEFDDDGGAGACNVIAADQLSDLGNRFVGSEPWAMQWLRDRAKRILAAVGVSDAGLTVADRPATVQISRMDVDRQAAAPLLQDLAVSTGAILWAAYDPAKAGPYLYYEDPAKRASLYVLAQNLATLLWAPAPGSGAGTPLSSCQVLRDPVRWSRAVTDLITRATVRWRDQSTAPGTTERTVQLIDTAAEAAYGARGISIGTDLTTSTDADSLAAGTLAAHQPSPSWRTTGLTWDLAQAEPADTAAQDLAFTLLGGVTRLGYAISLTDLPYWTPTTAAVQLYIEGGTYTYDTDDGGTPRWVLELNGSPATGLGGSLSYGSTDLSIRYADVDRAVTYLSMIGVGPAGATGPDWADIPTATTWASVPSTIDWSEDPR
jgi:hypothetical protein